MTLVQRRQRIAVPTRHCCDERNVYGVAVGEDQAKLTLSDSFDIHLDHAPKAGAELVLDPIVLVARSISGGRVNVVGLRLPEDEEVAAPLTRRQAFKRKLADIWSSVAGV